MEVMAPDRTAELERSDRLEAFDEDGFVALAQSAGLDVSAADLAQLNRRNLLLDGRDGAEAPYRRVHLYVLARYLEAVRPVRHPWTTVAPELTLQDVNALSTDCARALAALGGEEADRGAVEALAGAVEALAAEVDPFGPLVELLDLLSDDAREAIGGAGRLYLELRRGAQELRGALARQAAPSPPEADAPPQPDEAPPTEPIDLGAVAEDAAAEDAAAEDAAAEDAVAEDAVAEDAVAEDAVAEDAVADEAPAAPEAGEAPGDEPEVPAADEAVSEELVGLPADADNPFDRPQEATTRTRDLQERLQKLRHDDRQSARPPAHPPSSSTAADAASEPREADGATDEAASDEAPAGEAELASRIRELNRLREQYMATKDWQALAELYEDGLELFSSPTERQQVLLMLGMLYEVRLDSRHRAFSAFARAWAVDDGPEQGRQKAFEGLRRLGEHDDQRDDLLGWLEDQLFDAPQPGLLDALVAVLADDERHAEAYGTLNRFVESRPDEPMEARAHHAMARISLEHLHAPEEAARHLELALALGGPTVEILEALVGVHLQTDRVPAAVDAIESLCEQASLSLDDRIEWLMRGVEAAKEAGLDDDSDRLLGRIRDLQSAEEPLAK